MANSDSDNSSSMSGQLARLMLSAPGIALAVALTSLLLSSFRFELASRGNSNGVVRTNATNPLRVSNRIWQDQDQLLNPEKLGNAQYVREASETNWSEFARRLLDHEPGQTNAVLFVVTHPSSFAHGVESRLRTRSAVLCALQMAGLAKQNSEETRFVLLPSTTNYLVPCELFISDQTSRPQSSREVPSKVLVIWLPEKALNNPWVDIYEALQKLLNSDQPNNNSNLKIGVLGPRTSDGLNAWFSTNTLSALDECGPAKKLLDGISVLSTSARAPDAFFQFETNGLPDRPRGMAETVLRKYLGNARLVHFGGTDERLCFALAAELKLRNVDVTRDKVLLLSEYDTFYGRSLPLSFMAVVEALRTRGGFDPVGMSATNLLDVVFSRGTNNCYSAGYTKLLIEFTNALSSLRTNKSSKFSNISYYTYLAGLDGNKTVQDSSKDGGGQDKAQRNPHDMLDQPIGEQQLDYTRRLGFSLGGGIDSLSANDEVKAVGLLGSDVFDKMLMLQILKKRLPNCVFFTTELDDCYTMPTETGWTRNLIVASGFGQAPAEFGSFFGFAPFRDSYQTAAYQACLKFLTGNTNLPTDELALYEIGRSMPHPLSTSSSDRLALLKNFLAGPWEQIKNLASRIPQSPALILGFSIAFLFVVATIFPSRQGALANGMWALTFVMLDAIALAVIFNNGLETLDIGDGVSVLSSAILMLLAVQLTLYGLVRTLRTSSWQEVSQELGFVVCIVGMVILAVLGVFLRRTPMRSPGEVIFRSCLTFAWAITGVLCISTSFFWRAFLKKTSELVAKAERLASPPPPPLEVRPPPATGFTSFFTKHAGRLRATHARIFARLKMPGLIALLFALMAVIYIGLSRASYSAWQLFLGNREPIAFEVVRTMEAISCLAIFAINASKIYKRFTSAPVHGPTAPVMYFAIVTDAAELSRSVDKFGPLAYYPMCALLLLCLAHSSWLDAWHPSKLLNALVVVQAAILVILPFFVNRKATEFKRLLAYYVSLQRINASSSATPPVRLTLIEQQEKALEQLNRGCFAPVAQQPVLGAVATLVGGSGIVTLLQQLPPH